METSINYITWATSANGEYCREIWAQDKKEVKVFIIAPADAG